jgi:hypothetical protein
MKSFSLLVKNIAANDHTLESRITHHIRVRAQISQDADSTACVHLISGSVGGPISVTVAGTLGRRYSPQKRLLLAVSVELGRW